MQGDIAKQMKDRNTIEHDRNTHYAREVEARTVSVQTLSERNKEQTLTIISDRLCKNENVLDSLESDPAYDPMNPTRRIKRLREDI